MKKKDNTYRIYEIKKTNKSLNEEVFDFYICQDYYKEAINKIENHRTFFSLKIGNNLVPKYQESNKISFLFNLKYSEIEQINNNNYCLIFANGIIEKKYGKNYKKITQKQIEEIKGIFEWLNLFLSKISYEYKKDLQIDFFPEIYFDGKNYELDAIFILKKNSSYKIFNIEYKEYIFLEMQYHDSFFFKKEIEKLKILYFFYYSWIIDDEIYSVFLTKTKTEYYKKIKFLILKDRDIYWKNFENHFLKDEEENILNEDLRLFFLNNFTNPIRQNLYQIENSFKILNVPFINEILFAISKNKIVLIHGEPGTGKTLVFYYLKKHFGEKAYSTIFNQYFCIDDINQMISTISLLSNINKKDKEYIIIDEAQLASKEVIQKSLENNFKVILIGDHKQKMQNAFVKNEWQFNIEEFTREKKTKEYKNVFKLTDYFRLSKNSLICLEYILGIEKNIKKIKKDPNFFIDYKENIKEFISEFEIDKKNNSNSVMGVLSTTKWKNLSKEIQKSFKGQLYLKKDISFENKNNYSKLMKKNQYTHIFNTYYLISFEYDKVFLYFPENFDFIKVSNDYISFGEESSPIINELWILFTRARKKIIIFSENTNTKNYLKKKIEKIKLI